MGRHGIAAIAALLAGCVGSGEPGDPGDVGSPDRPETAPAARAPVPDPEPPPVIFDENRLLEDEDMLGGADITAADIQAFLESEGSFLATYVDADAQMSAAEIIADRCEAFGISPLYMLARVQAESSLVSSGSSDNLDAATGCGCPDGLGCDPGLSGFASQIDCAAYKTRSYITDLDAGDPTIAGWNVGVERDTLDPCAVVPANRATAALYTYTPWVGAHAEGCGRGDVGGSSLVALVFHRFRGTGAFPL